MTFEQSLDPITNSIIRIKLFSDVKNVAEVRGKIVAGKLKCCVINPKLIVDPFQVIVAANKAAIADKQGKLVTHTIYSEILFNLSISKNIRSSLQQFGINDKYTDILVAVIGKKDENNDDVFKNIEGKEQDIEELKNLTDMKTVMKVYSITAEEEKFNCHCRLQNVIVNKIVIKHIH